MNLNKQRKDNPVSAQRVSKAARQLGKDIEAYLGLQNATKPIDVMIAKMIQAKLADLISKARATVGNHSAHRELALDAALVPWEPEGVSGE